MMNVVVCLMVVLVCVKVVLVCVKVMVACMQVVAVYVMVVMVCVMVVVESVRVVPVARSHVMSLLEQLTMYLESAVSRKSKTANWWPSNEYLSGPPGVCMQWYAGTEQHSFY
jgi:hypothetical protein